MRKAAVVAFLVVLPFVAAGVRASDEDEHEGAPKRVLLMTPAEVSRATDVLVGAGIVLPDGRSTAPRVGPSGQLVWKQYRDDPDRYGIRHAFYRQDLKPTGRLAGVLPVKYQTDGVPLPDTAVGLHFKKNGVLSFVYGHQVTVAQAGNFPRLNTSQAAAYAALAAVMRSGDYVPFDPSLLDPTARTQWEESAELALRWHQPSGSLKLTWRIVVPAASGEGRIPIIDAETGNLIEYHAVAANAFPCPPNETAPVVYGRVCPQWSSCSYPWVQRPVPATWRSNAAQACFEAHWPRDPPYNPPIQVFRDTTDSGPCDFGTGFLWMDKLLLPRTSNNTPWFGDTSTMSIEREAGDVLYYTRKAFETSFQYGWLGYWGLRDISMSTPARIMLDKTIDPNDSHYDSPVRQFLRVQAQSNHHRTGKGAGHGGDRPSDLCMPAGTERVRRRGRTRMGARGGQVFRWFRHVR